MGSLVADWPTLVSNNTPFPRSAAPGGPMPAAAAADNTPDTAPRFFDGNRAVAAFEAITYRAERVALGFQYQRQTGDGNPGADDRQLRFDFFFETRKEEVALFRQRAGAAGAAAGSERLQAVAGRIAAKFEISLVLTGAALDGFAGAAEGAAGARDLIDRLAAFADRVLQQSDALFQEIFALLGGGAAKSDAGFVDRFLKGIDEVLRQAGLPGPGGGQGGGRSVNLFGFQLEFSFSFSAEAVGVEVQQADPIVLDLNGNGFDLTSHRDGARFDILGNGRMQTTAFVTGGDAFLAIDRNGNGVIDSGKELFGDQNGAANGFEELHKLDSNGDGVIDKRDRDFDKLLLWRDNGNGITEPGELISLRDAGIAAIDLNYTNTNLAAAGGNRIAQIASFLRADGTRGLAGDVLLNYTA